MKKYLLTICIPTCNRSSLLRGLLENISAELDNFGHAEDIEVLIVDGKSDDDTAEMVEKFPIKADLTYYRTPERRGIDKDILKCVELANGEYCWLFSDDDRFTTGAISHLIKTLKRERGLAGCFCNRTSYDFQLGKRVTEAKGWPGKIFNDDHVFTDKRECFKYIGMDFGFISSQVVNRSKWQGIVKGQGFGELYNSYYLMVHIIAKMMDKEFKWLYICRPMVKQRTGNDSLLNNEGVMKRQMIEHNSFDKIVSLHYDYKSPERTIFFNKMVNRLPRVIANLKSQNVSFLTQLNLLKLLYSKYNGYYEFWIKVIPIFLLPNITFNIIKKFYFKYWI